MTKGQKKTKRLTWNVPESCSHPRMLQDMPIELLDSGVNAEESKSHLQTLIERGMAEWLTLDTLTRSRQIGDLKKDVRRSDKLTVEYRKQRECWRDDGEYG